MRGGCVRFAPRTTFLASPSEALDELIEGVCILKGQNPARERISEDEARRVAAQAARVQTETVKQGSRNNLQLRADGTKSLAGHGSNNREHLLRRVARAAPDTLAAYEAGEFPSARAAAKAAGIPVADGLG